MWHVPEGVVRNEVEERKGRDRVKEKKYPPLFLFGTSLLCGPLEKGMANLFSILALRTP